jgi:FtsH-binding integral membrane protein
MNVEINYLAVFLAGLSSMVVGAIWYAKPVMGNTWQKLVGLKDEDLQKGMAKAMILTLLASMVTAYVLAHVAFLSNKFFGHSFMQDAVMTAFWLWLGFTAARMLTHDLFERRPTKLTMMALTYELITILVMGVIIGMFKP